VAALLGFALTNVGSPATAAPGERDPRGSAAHPDRQLARGCRDKNLVPTVANLERIRVATQCLINQRRRTKRLRPLKANVELRRAAQDFSSRMVREGFFDHVAPDGSTLITRVEDTRYLIGARMWWLGENLDFDVGREATPLLTVRRWMGSPQHRIHILDRRYRDLGIGVTVGLPTGAAGSGATYSAVFAGRTIG
jgi:uncharacterized protein YkwD